MKSRIIKNQIDLLEFKNTIFNINHLKSVLTGVRCSWKNKFKLEFTSEESE